jgi:hypothetical protein
MTNETNQSLDQLDPTYFSPRVIDGKVCALSNFLFTIGLMVDIKNDLYERRYCFENYADAKAALNDWDGTGHPDGPWIKCKGVYEGVGIDLTNPKLEQKGFKP